MKNLLFLCFFLSIFCLSAQQCFEAVKTVGCAPFTVQLKNCGTTKNPIYVFEGDANDLTKATKDTFYTYTKAGYYDVHQLVGTTTIEAFTKEKYIRVVDNPEPTFKIFACEGRNVTVEITENHFDNYTINFGDNSPLITIKGLESYTHTYADTILKNVIVEGSYNDVDCKNEANKNILPIEKLVIPTILFSKNNDNKTFSTNLEGLSYLNYGSQQLENNLYINVDSFSIPTNYTHTLPFSSEICVKYRSFDFCGNQLISSPICSFSLTGKALNNENILTWNEYPLKDDVKEYQVYRNEELIYTGNESTFTDTNLQCGKNYCYEIHTILLSNSISKSNTVCLIAFSTDTPPEIQNLVSSIEDNKIILKWDTLTTAKTIFITEENEEKSIDYTSTNQSTFTIDSIQEKTIYCYQLHYEDVCDNLLDTKIKTCPILLSYEQNNLGNELTWTDYENFSTEEYIVHWLDTEKNSLKSVTSENPLTYLDSDLINAQQFYYQIEVQNENGLQSFSNLILIEQSSKIFFPTAFSPNENGENDIFKPVGSFIESYQLSIFDQKGKILSEQKNKGWDGKVDGKLVPIGVYGYFAQIVDEKGKKIIKQGTFTIIY